MFRKPRPTRWSFTMCQPVLLLSGVKMLSKGLCVWETLHSHINKLLVFDGKHRDGEVHRTCLVDQSPAGAVLTLMWASHRVTGLFLALLLGFISLETHKQCGWLLQHSLADRSACSSDFCFSKLHSLHCLVWDDVLWVTFCLALIS